MGEDFPQDLACQLISSDAGYGPKVYFFDEAQCVTIMDYHFPEALPTLSIRLQALVNLLKKIHFGPLIPKGAARSQYLDFLINELKDKISFFDLELIGVIKDTVFATTRLNGSSVVCHRDLHHGNLLYTKGGFLTIDYTWAGIDDPYVDLANIAVFNCKTQEEERLLLQIYCGHEPGAKEMARLALLKLPTKMFYGLECLRIAYASQTNEPLLIQAPSQAYMNFGMHGRQALKPSDFLNYGFSFFSEVFDYSQSERYRQDLKEV